MNEFEIYRKEAISFMTDFLNRTMDGEQVVNEFTNRFAEKFALTQEQRCAVKIALVQLSMLQIHYGEVPDCFAGIAVNLITHILLKDWEGVEGMLND
jgi:hypothetical protein